MYSFLIQLSLWCLLIIVFRNRSIFKLLCSFMPPAGCLCQHVRHPLSHFPNLASCSTVIADLFLCKKTKSDSFPLEADAEVSLPTMIISFGAGTSSPFMDLQILQNSWTSFQTLSSPHTLHWKSITGQMDAMPLQYRAVFFSKHFFSFMDVRPFFIKSQHSKQKLFL